MRGVRVWWGRRVLRLRSWRFGMEFMNLLRVNMVERGDRFEDVVKVEVMGLVMVVVEVGVVGGWMGVMGG